MRRRSPVLGLMPFSAMRAAAITPAMPAPTIIRSYCLVSAMESFRGWLFVHPANLHPLGAARLFLFPAQRPGKSGDVPAGDQLLRVRIDNLVLVSGGQHRQA